MSAMTLETISGERPVAVVTGAARRVGRAIALSLARRGMAVVIHYGTSHEEAESLVAMIRDSGHTAIAVSADLRKPKAAAVKVFEAAQALGRVSVLINSASVYQDQPLESLEEDHCDRQLTVNLLAPIFLAQQFEKQVAEAATGHVINLLDWAAERPGPGHLVYTASKAALLCATKTLAQQLAPRIRVNGIALGAILPPDDEPDKHRERAAETIPLQHAGSPEDVCEAIGFLLKSQFITGEILHISGGEEL